jgi:hypothetical protein
VQVWKRRVAAAGIAMGWLAATAIPAGAVAPTTSAGNCTTYGQVAAAPAGKIPRDDYTSVRSDPLAKWKAANPSKARAAAAAAGDGTLVTIPVAFHVIYKSQTYEGGFVPQQQIRDQITVLNDAYRSTGFQFRLVSTTRTRSPEWFSNLIYTSGSLQRFERGSSREIKMKRALHEGGAQTLNFYTAALGKHLLGWAYFASDFTGANGETLPRLLDGVVMEFRSLPGGTFGPYSEGDTATHEVGHWLNLFHTFQNGCQTPGDEVADTPYEAAPSFFCDARDSCTNKPGTDPIHNYMDYSPDPCLTEFTQGQAARMNQAWVAYRAG